MQEQKKILILLAAYRGTQFVGEQIDSILAQDCDDWSLVLSDDGDFTQNILDAYAERYPEKIIRYKSGLRFGSAKAHFMHLISHFKEEASYIMLSNQDDIWDKDKVRKTLAVMQKTETDFNGPILVHTDLRVVDASLHEICPSFFAYTRIGKRRYKPNEVIIQNPVSGCTLMMNRKLAMLVSCALNPEKLVMHDNWIALVATFMGKIIFLDAATMDYRQHEDNTCGAKSLFSLSYIIAAAKRSNYKALSVEAKYFLECYESRLTAPSISLIKAVSSLGNVSKFTRIKIYCKFNLWLYPFIRRIGQIVFW